MFPSELPGVCWKLWDLSQHNIYRSAFNVWLIVSQLLASLAHRKPVDIHLKIFFVCVLLVKLEA